MTAKVPAGGCGFPYADWAVREGKIKPRLELAVDRLRDLARDMQGTEQVEPGNDPWGVVGCFVQMVACLLDHAEGSSRW